MSGYASVLIVSLVCSSGVAACGGANPGAVPATSMAKPAADAQLLVEESLSAYDRGDWDEAIAQATEAIELEPDDELLLTLHLLRALTYGRMGRFDEVVADATTAIDLEPPPAELAHLYGLRAEAFAEMGRLDDAAADLELAVQASPDVAPAAQQVRDRFGIPGTEPVDHRDRLAAGETPLLAQQLVDVGGYTYVDARTGELDHYLALIDDYDEDNVGADLVDGASWHSVVADDPSQNTTSNVEVGFLMLMQRNASINHDVLVEHVRTFWLSGEPLEELDIGGVAVRVFENPDRPDSRYFYTWALDDVSGVFDGAGREPLERWLTAYLEQQ